MKQDLARCRRKQAQDQPACRGFSGTRFAHQPQYLTLFEIEAYIIHGMDEFSFLTEPSLFNRKIFLEMPDRKKKVGVCRCRPFRGFVLGVYFHLRGSRCFTARPSIGPYAREIPREVEVLLYGRLRLRPDIWDERCNRPEGSKAGEPCRESP